MFVPEILDALKLLILMDVRAVKSNMLPMYLPLPSDSTSKIADPTSHASPGLSTCPTRQTISELADPGTASIRQLLVPEILDALKLLILMDLLEVKTNMLTMYLPLPSNSTSKVANPTSHESKGLSTCPTRQGAAAN